MDLSRSLSKKYRGQHSRKKSLSRCLIVCLIILATTWFCPITPGDYVYQSSLQLPQKISSPCDGRRVHIYDMPEVFNTKFLEYCDGGLVHWIRFCKHYRSYGFGENLTSLNFREDWYRTDAYMLEVIFFERMRSYPCLTSSRAAADIFFVPYFAGLAALPYLYDLNKMKEEQGDDVVSWLRENAGEWWGRYSGRDHFMIAGRTAWDFHTPSSDGWGTSFFDHPELQNTTFVVLERRPWRTQEQAVPYPVGFHPSSTASLERWIHRVRTSVRTALFSFSGALRPKRSDSIRGFLSNECVNASTECSRLDCAQISCSHNPEPIYESLLKADFCLQPRGDTATRRSTMDSIVSGCIPVLFHEDSAAKQYAWHFPQDYASFSVFIPESDIVTGRSSVREVLKQIAPGEVRRMRENVISMIPSMLYRHPSAEGFASQDAFDLTIEGMSRKVASFKGSQKNR